MSTFDPTAYYRLSSDLAGNLSLSLGQPSSPPSTPFLSPSGSYSSENWQLFYDSGVYFIRNYDYGADYQLGITEGNRSLPVMINSKGTLGMQWNLTQWSGENSGTWRFTNGLLGFGDDLFLGVSESSEGDAPAINTDTTGSHWTLDINVSAGTITDSSQLAEFESIQTATATTTTATTATTIPTSTTPAALPHSKSSNSISGGAIAGIAIGAVAVILLLLAGFFFYRRRRNQHRYLAPPATEETTPKPFSDGSTTAVQDYRDAGLVMRSELGTDKTRSELAAGDGNGNGKPTDFQGMAEMPAERY